MDKFKEVNDAILSYTVDSTRQVVELNQKLWQDYISLTNSLVALTPGLPAIMAQFKK